MKTVTGVPYSTRRSEFINHYGGIYEHSPWIAKSAWEYVQGSRVQSMDQLAAIMVFIVTTAPPGQQLALIRAHPELAGRVRLAQKLTRDSEREQNAAGLDQCTPEELNQFKELNAAYNAKFRFPFIIAVEGMTREIILNEFAARLANEQDDEFLNALSEIHKIASLRLQRLRE